MSGAPDIQKFIRVDHAGEYGAARIYAGQLAVLKNSPHAPMLEHMQAQERQHLAAFSRLVAERRVRPTALLPFWHLAGFAFGAATASLGPKAAMACTVAVEEVIDGHYRSQEAALAPEETPLRETIAQFRAEEIQHRDLALAQGAEQAPGYRLLSALIRTGCRAAIRLSERI